MISHHVAYGLQIAANAPLPGLPIEFTPRKTDVQVRLKEKFPFPTKFHPSSDNLLYSSPNLDEEGLPNLQVGMLDDGKHYGFFYRDGARFAIECGGREIVADWPENYTLEDACTYLMGPVIAFALRLRGTTCLHASAIAVDGRAIALFGLAGAGKSTTAAAFALGGFPVLSDDVAALAEEGDRFLVQPGYPRVNLWPDSVLALFGSEDALPHITPTWGKRYLPLDRDGFQFQSEPLALGAIYILDEREAGLTTPIVEDIAGHQAFTTLVANTYVNYLLDRDMRTREFEVLGRVLPSVPIRRVRPTADPSRIFSLCEMIAADARQFLLHESSRAASIVD